MTDKHTPGPWQYSGVIGNAPGAVMNNSGLMQVATCRRDAFLGERPISLAEADANARLIAAAPLMLEALQALMTAYATVPGMSGLPMHNRGAWHQARAAIAAATGEDA